MEWLVANWPALAAALYVVVNEVIAFNDNWKSNSVIQLILNLLKAASGKKE